MSSIINSIKKSNDYINPINAINTIEKSPINSNLCHYNDYILNRRKYHNRAFSENFDYVKGESVDKDLYNDKKIKNNINININNNINKLNDINNDNNIKSPVKKELNNKNINIKLDNPISPNVIKNANNNYIITNNFNKSDLPFISEIDEKEGNLNINLNLNTYDDNHNNVIKSILKSKTKANKIENNNNNTNNDNSYNNHNNYNNNKINNLLNLNPNPNHEIQILDESNNLFNVKNRRFLKQRLENQIYNEK
jgi:hypothetical protein